VSFGKSAVTINPELKVYKGIQNKSVCEGLTYLQQYSLVDLVRRGTLVSIINTEKHYAVVISQTKDESVFLPIPQAEHDANTMPAPRLIINCTLALNRNQFAQEYQAKKIVAVYWPLVPCAKNVINN
jgi:hypothetical protein